MSYEMDRLIYGDEREAKGHAEGRQDQLFDLVLKGLLPLSVAAEEADLEPEAFEAALEDYKVTNIVE